MDPFEAAFVERDAGPVSQASLDAALELAPFRVAPFHVECNQGFFTYASVAFAMRANLVLFAANATRQLGVGVATPLDPTRLTTAFQYPSADIALIVFLRAAKFPDDADGEIHVDTPGGARR
jgi:hypothetical protein